jgi:hypothetical protein
VNYGTLHHEAAIRSAGERFLRERAEAKALDNREGTRLLKEKGQAHG